MWFSKGNNKKDVRIGDLDNSSVGINKSSFPELPTTPGIYKLVKNTNGKLEIEFESNIIKTKELILGNVAKKVQRVWNRFCNYPESVGSMNIGDSGSGKSLECDILANISVLRGNMPVIKVTGFSVRESEIQFFQGIDNCCLYFDEFVKHVDYNSQQKLLPLLTNTNKKFLILITENHKNSINEFILGRTQRIRYLEEYGKLDKQVIQDFISLFDVRQELIDELMLRYEKALVFSMDNLEAIISEHIDYPEESLDELLKYLNISSIKKDAKYVLIKVTTQEKDDAGNMVDKEVEKFVPIKITRDQLKDGVYVQPFENTRGFMLGTSSVKEVYGDILVAANGDFTYSFKYE